MENSTAGFDCYYILNSTKVLAISSAFCIDIINAILLYGIIWFEHFGSDLQRMLRNRLVSFMCWNAIFGVPSFHLLDIINYLTGPKPELFCYLLTFARNAVRTNGLVILNLMALTRYCLIFWRKNPASVNDEFWSLFLSFWAYGLSSIYNFVMVGLPRQVRSFRLYHLRWASYSSRLYAQVYIC